MLPRRRLVFSLSVQFLAVSSHERRRPFPAAQAGPVAMRPGRVVLFQPVVSQSSFQSDGELAGKTHLDALLKIKMIGL